ncbi:MAG: glycosyltransferase family 4 protein [Bacillota bacterium]|nr:glycosyltransferase family 4 protein [Bacillota bacterium]
MKVLNVLHISPMGRIGGIESRLIDLFNQHIPGVQFFLFSPTTIPPRWVKILIKLKIPFLQSINERFWEDELVAYVRQNKIDIAHFHHPLVKGVQALKIIGVKAVIYHDHGASWYGSPIVARERSEIVRAIDGIIAVSEASRIMIMERFNAPKSLINVIHNGIDFKHLLPHKTITKPRGKKVVATVCRLKPFKGVDSFIKAYPFVLERRKDVVFWIIGNGSERVSLETLTKQLGISNQVRFWGFQSNVGDFLRAADLFVLPSYREPFAGALIEAGYIAKPSIAANVDGNPEIILHNQTGILIDPTISVESKNPMDSPGWVVDGHKQTIRRPLALDPCRLSHFILHMLNNPERSHQIGLQARLRVKEYFNVNTYGKNLVAYYRKLLDGRRPTC